MGIELIISLGIATFVLILLSLILDKEHFLLKLFFIIAGVSLLVLIPKVGLDKTCYPVVANTTVTGNVTSYGYTNYCMADKEGSTGMIFYTSMLWIIRVFWIYAVIYFVYQLLLHYFPNLFGKRKT